jgi:hypothetical protein
MIATHETERLSATVVVLRDCTFVSSRRGSVRNGLGCIRSPLLLGDANLGHEGLHVAQADQIAQEKAGSVAPRG